MRMFSILLSVYFILTGFYIGVMPETFYRLTPGLDTMGPFNMHFIRDVALTFLVSGGAMLWGGACGAAAWPCSAGRHGHSCMRFIIASFRPIAAFPLTISGRRTWLR